MVEYASAKKKIFSNQDADDYAVLNHRIGELRVLEKQLFSQVIYFDIPSYLSEHKLFCPNQMAVYEVSKILSIDYSVCREVFDAFGGVGTSNGEGKNNSWRGLY